MPNRREQLINRALSAIQGDSGANSTVFGADASLEERLRIADALNPSNHSRNSHSSGHRTKSRVKHR